MDHLRVPHLPLGLHHQLVPHHRHDPRVLRQAPLRQALQQERLRGHPRARLHHRRRLNQPPKHR